VILPPERWPEFIDGLAGPAGCHFREEDGKIRWDCTGDFNKPLAVGILANMGLHEEDIAVTLRFCEQEGGHCDCEILLNVAEQMLPYDGAQEDLEALR
jgi:hypothetical protein